MSRTSELCSRKQEARQQETIGDLTTNQRLCSLQGYSNLVIYLTWGPVGSLFFVYPPGVWGLPASATKHKEWPPEPPQNPTAADSWCSSSHTIAFSSQCISPAASTTSWEHTLNISGCCVFVNDQLSTHSSALQNSGSHPLRKPVWT